MVECAHHETLHDLVWRPSAAIDMVLEGRCPVCEQPLQSGSCTCCRRGFRAKRGPRSEHLWIREVDGAKIEIGLDRAA